MRLMIVLDWSGSDLEDFGEKFASGDDVNPEKGKVVTRWHSPASKMSWVVADVPDAVAVQDWLAPWNDEVDAEIHPVLDDKEFDALLDKHVD